MEQHDEKRVAETITEADRRTGRIMLLSDPITERIAQLAFAALNKGVPTSRFYRRDLTPTAEWVATARRQYVAEGGEMLHNGSVVAEAVAVLLHRMEAV